MLRRVRVEVIPGGVARRKALGGRAWQCGAKLVPLAARHEVGILDDILQQLVAVRARDRAKGLLFKGGSVVRGEELRGWRGG